MLTKNETPPSLGRESTFTNDHFLTEESFMDLGNFTRSAAYRAKGKRVARISEVSR